MVDHPTNDAAAVCCDRGLLCLVVTWGYFEPVSSVTIIIDISGHSQSSSKLTIAIPEERAGRPVPLPQSRPAAYYIHIRAQILTQAEPESLGRDSLSQSAASS